MDKEVTILALRAEGDWADRFQSVLECWQMEDWAKSRLNS